jgi:MFS superfamily sulfate permease-like transporter
VSDFVRKHFACDWTTDEKLAALLERERVTRELVVVTAEPVTSVDVTSADMLAELEQTLRASRIEPQFADVKDPVREKLKRFGLLDQIGTDAFHPTIGAAVDAYLAEHAVDWKP